MFLQKFWIQCHAQDKKKTTQGYWPQQCIWHPERHSQEGRIFLIKSPLLKKEHCLGFWKFDCYDHKCQTDGGAYFAPSLGFHNSHTTPPPPRNTTSRGRIRCGDGTWLAVPYVIWPKSSWKERLCDLALISKFLPVWGPPEGGGCPRGFCDQGAVKPQGPCHTKNSTVIVIHNGGSETLRRQKNTTAGSLKHLVFLGKPHRKSPQVAKYHADSKLLRCIIFSTAGSFGRGLSKGA